MGDVFLKILDFGQLSIKCFGELIEIISGP